MSRQVIGKGEGTESFEKKTFPRLLTLLYIIQHDFNLTTADFSITQGNTTSQMMRQLPYVRIEIPNLNRVVYLCDEEGNVSYVFDVEKLNKAGITLPMMDINDKEKNNTLITSYPGIGIRIPQSQNWRYYIAQALEKEIHEIPIKDFKTDTIKGTSEFSEKKESLPFDIFQTEVRKLYQGQENRAKWYRSERGNHLNWPASPDITYKDKGWVGFPELVGIENRSKKEYLPFDIFQAEVRVEYLKSGQSNVQRWYRKERENHLNWPAKGSHAIVGEV